jgi:hypothetical protein
MNSPCNNVDEVKRMGESLLEAMQAQVCDRLIDRLGLALEVARTAARLRDEAPVELELRGLSRAEYDFIKALFTRWPWRPRRPRPGPGTRLGIAQGPVAQGGMAERAHSRQGFGASPPGALEALTITGFCRSGIVDGRQSP